MTDQELKLEKCVCKTAVEVSIVLENKYTIECPCCSQCIPVFDTEKEATEYWDRIMSSARRAEKLQARVWELERLADPYCTACGKTVEVNVDGVCVDCKSSVIWPSALHIVEREDLQKRVEELERENIALRDACGIADVEVAKQRNRVAELEQKLEQKKNYLEFLRCSIYASPEADPLLAALDETTQRIAKRDVADMWKAQAKLRRQVPAQPPMSRERFFQEAILALVNIGDSDAHTIGWAKKLTDAAFAKEKGPDDDH